MFFMKSVLSKIFSSLSSGDLYCEYNSDCCMRISVEIHFIMLFMRFTSISLHCLKNIICCFIDIVVVLSILCQVSSILINCMFEVEKMIFHRCSYILSHKQRSNSFVVNLAFKMWNSKKHWVALSILGMLNLRGMFDFSLLIIMLARCEHVKFNCRKLEHFYMEAVDVINSNKIDKGYSAGKSSLVILKTDARDECQWRERERNFHFGI